MKPFFSPTPANKLEDEANEQRLTRDEEQLYHITDGGEFLDDAIRTKDQPLLFREEQIPAGSREKLL